MTKFEEKINEKIKKKKIRNEHFYDEFEEDINELSYEVRDATNYYPPEDLIEDKNLKRYRFLADLPNNVKTKEKSNERRISQDERKKLKLRKKKQKLTKLKRRKKKASKKK